MAAPFTLGPVWYGKDGDCGVFDVAHWQLNPATGNLDHPFWAGCQHGDGWVPIPHPSGYGWKWAGATAADYNQYFRQSLGDLSAIQGAPPTVDWMNGRPKFLDLVNGEDPRAFTLANPGVECVVRGWHSAGRWDAKVGGDGSIVNLGCYWRDGACVKGKVPSHDSHDYTGFLVVGGLALAGVGLAASGAIAGGEAVAGGVQAATAEAVETAAAETAAASTSAAAAAGTTSLGSLLGTAGSALTSLPGLGSVGGVLGTAGSLLGKGNGMDDFSFGSIGDLIAGAAENGISTATTIAQQLGNLGINVGGGTASKSQGGSTVTSSIGSDDNRPSSSKESSGALWLIGGALILLAIL